MAAYQSKRDGRWRYRVRIITPDGTRLRISGSAPRWDNTEQRASKEEASHALGALTGACHPGQRRYEIFGDYILEAWAEVDPGLGKRWSWGVTLRGKPIASERGPFALYTSSGRALRVARNRAREHMGVPTDLANHNLLASACKAVEAEEDISVGVENHLRGMQRNFPGIKLTKANAIRALVLKALKAEEGKRKKRT